MEYHELKHYNEVMEKGTKFKMPERKKPINSTNHMTVTGRQVAGLISKGTDLVKKAIHEGSKLAKK